MPGMTDTLDFVKNLWGSMNIPGTNMSAMGTPPLSADELDKRIADLKAVETWLNLNLTMLRGTIQTMEVQRATLATLKSMGASMAEVMRQSGVSADAMASMPFGPFFGQPAAGTDGGAGAATAQDQEAAATGMPVAMAWWNMLQEQFTQAVATAMGPADGASRHEPQAAAAQPQQQQSQQKQSPQQQPQQPPQQQQKGQRPAADTPAAGNGNGKERAAKPKADNK